METFSEELKKYSLTAFEFATVAYKCMTFCSIALWRPYSPNLSLTTSKLETINQLIQKIKAKAF